MVTSCAVCTLVRNVKFDHWLALVFYIFRYTMRLLTEVAFVGASGNLTFDENGDRKLPYDLYAIADAENGSYVVP